MSFDLNLTANMMKFVDNIIYCSIADILASKKIIYKGPFASLTKTDKQFTQNLYNYSNTIMSKTQIYYSFHNATCF